MRKFRDQAPRHLACRIVRVARSVDDLKFRIVLIAEGAQVFIETGLLRRSSGSSTLTGLAERATAAVSEA